MLYKSILKAKGFPENFKSSVPLSYLSDRSKSNHNRGTSGYDISINRPLDDKESDQSPSGNFFSQR